MASNLHPHPHLPTGPVDPAPDSLALEVEAALVLEDGTVFLGLPFGARQPAAAEVVFNTGVTGYQEIATDPSYRGQMVVLCHPQIGNYGVAASADESVRPWVAALVVRELAQQPHHWEASETLDAYLARWGVPGIQGVDTRALVRHLREAGTLRGVLQCSAPGGFTPTDLDALRVAARNAPSVSQLELVQDVSAILPAPPAPSNPDRPVVLLDCGAKWNILRSLERRGIEPLILPWDASPETILERDPAGIVISNGPGDPTSHPTLVTTIQRLIPSRVPILGICLGHQLIGLAAGATTSRLKYGHHGGNHPVRDLATGHVTVTTQNHEFQVDAASLPESSGFVVSHLNLNDGSVEGLRHCELPVSSVQFHPEGAPGPQDNQPLFDDFMRQIGREDAA